MTIQLVQREVCRCSSSPYSVRLLRNEAEREQCLGCGATRLATDSITVSGDIEQMILELTADPLLKAQRLTMNSYIHTDRRTFEGGELNFGDDDWTLRFFWNARWNPDPIR